jgi:hypothetical protein
MITQPDQLTLTDIQREHPTWLCWKAVSGRYLARPADAERGDPAPITADTLPDLAGQLRDADPLQRMDR